MKFIPDALGYWRVTLESHAPRIARRALCLPQPPLEFFLMTMREKEWDDITVITSADGSEHVNPTFQTLEIMDKAGSFDTKVRFFSVSCGFSGCYGSGGAGGRGCDGAMAVRSGWVGLPSWCSSHFDRSESYGHVVHQTRGSPSHGAAGVCDVQARAHRKLGFEGGGL